MKKSVDLLLFLLFKLIKGLFSLFPRKFCLALGRKLGLLFFLCDKRRQHIAISNLSFALGKNHSPKSLKSIARSSFSHFGEVLMDFIKFSTLKEHTKSRLINVEGAEHIQNALKEKKGALLFTGHFGNWEIAPYFVSRLGPLKVMARPLDNVFLEKELLQMRLDLGEEVIYKQKAAREVTFHRRTQAPIIPVFSIPSSAHTFHIKILPPVKISLSGDREQDVLKITQICTKIIENQIRDNPKYWLWFHNRWKTRPESETRPESRNQ